MEQIQHAVQLAVDLDKQIRIRSGGHSLAGWTLCADSILIDLVDFRHLEYDATTAIASASPSATSAQLNDLLVPHGRFVPVGHCGDVGLGGFFLQGGMGLNCRVR
jgi:FAD/FMN-containing dehydrogenase